MNNIFNKYRPDWFDLHLVPAAISGVLLAAAFPPISQGWLAFVALVPLLISTRRHPFASGFVCGISFFAPLLYWLNIVMTSYGGLAPFFSVIAWLLFCGYLALFFGAAFWLVSLLQRHLGLLPVFSLPVIWVALEYLRGHLFTGFPWGLIGYAAVDMTQLRQTADLFGVYGLSLLFVLCNCAITLVIERRRNLQAIFGVLICLLLSGGGMFYGHQALRQTGDEHPQLRVGLIQGNIEQSHKWDRKYRQQTLDRYRDLSFSAVEKGAELLVWPEATTPFYMQDDSVDSRQVLQISKATGRYLLFGGPSYQSRPDGGYIYYNSAFLHAPDGSLLGRSDKIHLVPFGEYVPLGKLLFFVNKLVSGVGDFSPGEVKPLAMNGYDFGVLICYEAIFPELARSYVQKGSDLLINLTNDAWFGRSSAPRQLLDMTRMRAIENRIWIARAANTGISALISPDGRTHQETPIFETLSVLGNVELGPRPSFYSKNGDLLPWLCILLSAVSLLLVCIFRHQYAKGR